ncbi:hypothetical protein AB4212_01470, partial [Streptomyces sp. 2MCAF27]
MLLFESLLAHRAGDCLIQLHWLAARRPSALCCLIDVGRRRSADDGVCRSWIEVFNSRLSSSRLSS